MLPSLKTPRNMLAGLHILVVDDSPSILMLVEQMLLLEGGRCTVAESAEHAFHALQNTHDPVDAVLMDIQMPVMDGLQAMQHIRQELGFNALPLIAMTAGILQEQLVAARAAGANDTVHKPIRIDTLVQCILRWARPPGSPKINVEHATKTLGEDKAMLQRLLRVFLQEHAATVAHARADLANRSVESAARRIHRLRGGAGQLGALELQRAAQAAEHCIMQGNDSIHEKLLQVEQELQALRESPI